jgi:hypothetical protein
MLTTEHSIEERSVRLRPALEANSGDNVQEYLPGIAVSCSSDQVLCAVPKCDSEFQHIW